MVVVMLGVGKTKLHAVSPYEMTLVMRPCASILEVPLPSIGTDESVIAGSVGDEGAVAVCALVVEVIDGVPTVLGSIPTVLDVVLNEGKLEGASGLGANEVVGPAGVEGPVGVSGPNEVEGATRVEGATETDVAAGFEGVNTSEGADGVEELARVDDPNEIEGAARVEEDTTETDVAAGLERVTTSEGANGVEGFAGLEEPRELDKMAGPTPRLAEAIDDLSVLVSVWIVSDSDIPETGLGCARVEEGTRLDSERPAPDEPERLDTMALELENPMELLDPAIELDCIRADEKPVLDAADVDAAELDAELCADELNLDELNVEEPDTEELDAMELDADELDPADADTKEPNVSELDANTLERDAVDVEAFDVEELSAEPLDPLDDIRLELGTPGVPFKDDDKDDELNRLLKEEEEPEGGAIVLKGLAELLDTVLLEELGDRVEVKSMVLVVVVWLRAPGDDGTGGIVEVALTVEDREVKVEEDNVKFEDLVEGNGTCDSGNEAVSRLDELLLELKFNSGVLELVSDDAALHGVGKVAATEGEVDDPVPTLGATTPELGLTEPEPLL
jgi:hypothetical protein